jgi:hypothetical protein
MSSAFRLSRQQRAKGVRRKVIHTKTRAGQGHKDADLSEAEILATLHFRVLNAAKVLRLGITEGQFSKAGPRKEIRAFYKIDQKGIVERSIAEIDSERRNGYRWTGQGPKNGLADYPASSQNWTPGGNVVSGK